MNELVGKLGIDWKLLVAQFVNFAILLAILYRLLYKPVLEMFKKRSNIISKSVEEARKTEEGLRNLNETKERELQESRIAGKNIIKQAEQTAKEQGEKILTQKKQESEQLIAEGKNIIRAQKELMEKELTKETGNLAADMVEKMFRKGVSKEEHEKIIKNILETV